MFKIDTLLKNGEANGDEEGESKEGVIEQEVRTSRPLKQRVNPHLKLYVLHISGLIFLVSSFWFLGMKTHTLASTWELDNSDTHRFR